MRGVLADPDGFNATQGVPGKWHLLKQAAGQGDIVPNKSPTYPPFHAEFLRALFDHILNVEPPTVTALFPKEGAKDDHHGPLKKIVPPRVKSS